MQILYRSGYDPSEILNVKEIVACSWHDISYLVLKTADGKFYDATHLKSEKGEWVATLPENW